MMINLLMVLLVVMIFCNIIINNGKHKCPQQQFKINYVRGSRMPGVNYSNKIGVDIIILKLDRDIPCGIYTLKNVYGTATLFVGKNNNRKGYMTIKDMYSIEKVNIFDLWDIERHVSSGDLFADTYNRGCC